MQVLVDTLSGDTFTMQVKTIDTNAIVKARIQDQKGKFTKFIILFKKTTN